MAQGGKIKPHVLCLQDDHVIGSPGHGQNVIDVAVRYGTTTKHRLVAFEQVNHFIQTYLRHGIDLLYRPCSASIPYRALWWVARKPLSSRSCGSLQQLRLLRRW